MQSIHQGKKPPLKGIYEEGREELTMEMLKYLGTWWFDHVSGSDMEYGIWVKSRKAKTG